MKRISENECDKLYLKYHTPSHVIGHCKSVSNTALTIGKSLNQHGYHLDLLLIKGAGLAHDIARVKDDHQRIGADILEDLGYLDEADIVRVHMSFNFHQFSEINETDLVCLGDRLVKEDQYVGLDDRMDYIIHKPGENPERTARILEKKKETRELMEQIEKVIGQTIDSLFMEGRQYEPESNVKSFT